MLDGRKAVWSILYVSVAFFPSLKQNFIAYRSSEKNATDTYGMLQTAFRPSSMNRASVFEWHKRFKEGRESVRDDETCGRCKEVRTPELIGQIKIFMDKDRRVSIETINAQFDVSVGTVHTIIREELKMRKICAKAVPRVLREDQKERRCHDNREMVELIPQFSMPWWPAMKAGSTAMTQRPRDRVPSGSVLALLDPQTFDDPCFWQHWHDLRALGSHWADSQQGILCWGFKGVQGEIPLEEASTLEIDSVAFPPGQCTSPQLHPCHRLFDQNGYQDSSSASLQSRTCSLWLLVIP